MKTYSVSTAGRSALHYAIEDNVWWDVEMHCPREASAVAPRPFKARQRNLSLQDELIQPN